MRRMADIQTAEIDPHCQGNAFFQSAHDSLHETPHCLAQNWEDRCRYGNDTAIIRVLLPVLAEISGPRWASAFERVSILSTARHSSPLVRQLAGAVCAHQMDLGFTILQRAFDRISSGHGWQPVL